MKIVFLNHLCKKSNNIKKAHKQDRIKKASSSLYQKEEINTKLASLQFDPAFICIVNRRCYFYIFNFFCKEILNI